MIRTLRRTSPRAVPSSQAHISPPTFAVEAAGVSKSYGSNGQTVRALRDVEVSIRKGEMVAVMGPSGCGKTTLLNCLSGLDVIDSGVVRIAGTDTARLSDRDKTRFRAESMGFIFQTYNLLPVLSAVENVELPLIVSGVNARDARGRALRGLDRVGLADKANSRPSQLSGGQRQRVTIARSLVNNPGIVWADEPTGALDSATADDVMRLIEELNRDRGLTVVVVTHDGGVGTRCHRIIHMRDGMVVGEEQNR